VPPPPPAARAPGHLDAAAPGGGPEAQPLDVVGIGNALVDVVAVAGDDVLAAAGLVKGSMELVDLARAREIYAAMGPAVEVSGGSAANTMAGVAALGGRAGFVGKVADDDVGAVFTHDIRAIGVEFHPVVARPDGGNEELVGTGRSLVLVTGDAERTMATHLGTATTLSADELPVDFVARGRVVYLEGYLWDLPAAKKAMRRAIAECQRHDGAVALSLSDAFCVERHRRDFLELVRDDLDVLFGNEQEVRALFGARTLEAALRAAEETGLLVAVTRGALGCVVVTPRGPVAVPAAPVDHVVDVTGAGDLFAAGFLYGLTHGSGPEDCARLGALCASEVITHLGARPQADLRHLADEAGLLGQAP